MGFTINGNGNFTSHNIQYSERDMNIGNYSSDQSIAETYSTEDKKLIRDILEKNEDDDITSQLNKLSETDTEKDSIIKSVINLIAEKGISYVRNYFS